MSSDFPQTELIQDERIILNVGSVKYETYISTLTAYPDTLLGVMFSPRNREMLKIKNGEVFIDRDGYLFWYILQFYRTGVIPTIPTFNGTASLIAFSQEDLAREIDYYQLPLPAPTEQAPSMLANTLASKTVDDFISAICSTAKDTLANFRNKLTFSYFQYPKEHHDYWANYVVSDPWMTRLKEFELVGFVILESVGQEI
ncbi:2582_t:CDS:2, partial [Paraglomus occultum]